MLTTSKQLTGYRLAAVDGSIGECKDFLIDEKHWALRYLVADTRRWLPGRKVLISPIALDAPDHDDKTLPVALTRQQIKDSPPLDSDAPISRHYEQLWSLYYGHGFYWIGPGLWGGMPYPIALRNADQRAHCDLRQEAQALQQQHHLRSTCEVEGYQVLASDGKLGRVGEFLFDSVDWRARYIVIDTGQWLSGEQLVVPAQWIASVDWFGRSVRLGKKRSVLEAAPQLVSEEALDEDFELRLARYCLEANAQVAHAGHSSVPSSRAPKDQSGKSSKAKVGRDKVEEASKQSFPASDAPSY